MGGIARAWGAPLPALATDGLLVALPSSIGYNILTSQIRELAVQMDNFAQEFVAELQRMFVRE